MRKIGASYIINMKQRSRDIKHIIVHTFYHTFNNYYINLVVLTIQAVSKQWIAFWTLSVDQRSKLIFNDEFRNASATILNQWRSSLGLRCPYQYSRPVAQGTMSQCSSRWVSLTWNPRFGSPIKLGLHFTDSLKGWKIDSTSPSPGCEPRTCGVRAWRASTASMGFASTTTITKCQ